MARIILLVFIFKFFAFNNGLSVEGRRDVKDMEIENLKGLNKHVVKSIKSESGSIIDCIDIYKQPTLEHPLFKNHTIQMSPNGWDKEKMSSSKTLEQLWHKSGSCPDGTIPIVRPVNQKTDFPSPWQTHGSKDPNQGKWEKAILFVKEENVGAQASVNIWNVHVEPHEISSSFVSVGKLDSADIIQAGWMVSPDMYGDKATRLFTYWNSFGSSKGCYNLFCKGFIQVDKQTALGEALQVSKFEGEQTYMHVKIYKDTGNWWLYLNNKPIGYWPTSLFHDIWSRAYVVNWGGQVYIFNNGMQHTTTQMGSGHFPSEGFRKAATFYDSYYYNMDDKLIPSRRFNKYVNNWHCYDIDRAYGNVSFYYGGPGGAVSSCNI